MRSRLILVGLVGVVVIAIVAGTRRGETQGTRPLPGAVVFQKCSLRFLVAADLSVHRALAERPRPFPAWVPKNAEALGEGSFLTTTASACGSGGTTGSSGSRLRRYRFYGTPHSFDGAVLAFGRLAFSFEQAGLYVTALNGKEKEVARGDAPVGWLRSGQLLTQRWVGARTRLAIRAPGGSFVRVLGDGVQALDFDRKEHAVRYVDRGGLLTFADGFRRVGLANTRALGSRGVEWVQQLPRGRIGLIASNRVGVFDRNGSPLRSRPRRSRRAGRSCPMSERRRSSIRPVLIRPSTSRRSPVDERAPRPGIRCRRLPGPDLVYLPHALRYGSRTANGKGLAPMRLRRGSLRAALAREVDPGAPGSFPDELTNVNGTLYFSADDGVHGNEPWTAGP